MDEKKYSGGSVNISISMPAILKEDLRVLSALTGITRNRLIVNAIVDMVESKRSQINREGEK